MSLLRSLLSALPKVPGTCLLAGALVLSMEAGLPAQPPSQESASFPALLRQGFDSHQRGDYGAALPVLERALKLRPRDYYANLLVGIDLLRTGRAGDALPRLREASLQKPGDDIAFDYLTEANATLHRYADAAAASERAVQVAPTSDQALQVAIGFDLERFRSLSEQLRSSTPGLAAEQRLQAMSHPLTDPERLSLLQSSIQKDPNAPGIWSDLADTEHAQGYEDRARADRARADEHKPTPMQASNRSGNAAAYLNRGEALVRAQQWSAAVVPLERLLAGGVNSTYAQYLLCRAYAQRSGELANTMASEPSGAATVHMARGDLLLRIRNDPKAAIAEYTAGLSARPNDPALLERLGEAEARNGQMDAAIESARAALAVDPHRVAAMQIIGSIALEQRRYADALPYLEEMHALNPDDPAVQVELGTALARTDDSQEAVRLLRPALQRGYPDPKGSLHALLGGQLRRLGQSEEAAQAFAAARDLSDKYQKTSHDSAEDHEPQSK